MHNHPTDLIRTFKTAVQVLCPPRAKIPGKGWELWAPFIPRGEWAPQSTVNEELLYRSPV